MTKEEFLPTLSQKAQDIVNENLNIFRNMTFEIYYSNVFSKVIIKGNSNYKIYVKNDILKDVEYRFLHEFFHCIQYESKFPNLKALDLKYKNIASSITSLILDLDVREKLEYNGYFQNLVYIKTSVEATTKLLKMIQCVNDKTIMTSVDDMLTIAGILLTSDIAKIKNNELFIIAKTVRPISIKYYELLSGCLNLYTYDTSDGVNNIFEFLLDKMRLTSFIEIQTH